jgi:hypothetical protein
MARFSDAFADMLRLPSDVEVVDPMVKYFLTKSKEDFIQVLFPMSMTVFPTKDQTQHCGITRVDLNSLIPSPFCECNHISRLVRKTR